MEPAHLHGRRPDQTTTIRGPRTFGVAYNAANQITALTSWTFSETRTYNSLSQLTRIQQSNSQTSLLNMDVTYSFSPNFNNGQIVSSVDAISGESISYQYDALKRLSSASSNKNWSESYTYDGFSNLTGMSPAGAAPKFSLNADPNTNQVTGPGRIGYDLNGNLTSSPLWSLSYDVANRVVAANGSAYMYDSSNHRIYARTSGGTETFYLYSLAGEKLATYTVAGFANNAIQLTLQSTNVYFAGRVLSAEGNNVGVDRLGSLNWSSGPNGLGHLAQYPYGVEYQTTANDREKYATYTRDSVTGLDYAVNRYYWSQWGRFMSPDPSWESVVPGDPQTWNQYTYALGDPLNGNDPLGLCDSLIAGINMKSASNLAFEGFATELGAEVGYPYSDSAGPFGVPLVLESSNRG